MLNGNILGFLKKPAQSTILRRLSRIEPDAHQFWRWLQGKFRCEGLVEHWDVLLDGTTLEPVLFDRVNESVLERFKGCNFGKKVVDGEALVFWPKSPSDQYDKWNHDFFSFDCR